jgi:L-ascorbate metabolism protein UlaG (beta-lactamase superfamily)
VRYVANAGVLLSFGEARVLVDAPIRDGIPPYATSSSAERARLEGAEAPYDDVDAILVTHWHEDHFSAEAVAAHMKNTRRTVFISSPEVVERLREAAPGLPDARLHAVLPAPGMSANLSVRGMTIRVLRIRHNPARRFPEQHVGFLVGEAPAVLHVGDADPDRGNFALLESLPAIDVALVPHWYLQTDANRTLVRDVIRPRRIVAMHMPATEADAVRRSFAAAGVTAALLATPGTTVDLVP